MTKRDALLVVRLRRHGIANAILTLRAARKAGLPLDLACAFLEQESGGGRNVFGHDPTIASGWGLVTRAKYLRYKKIRGPRGEGGMQGVGPMQLTWHSFQDQADAQGGCWKPYPNMLVGFTIAARNIRRHGLMRGIAAYNGSGPAAERYAVSVRAKSRHWAQVVHAPVFRVPTIAGTHFTWAEVVRHSGYVKLPLRLRLAAVRQAKAMERLRSRLNQERRKHRLGPTGIAVLSWARSPEHNHDVGGAQFSQHLKADACDISLGEIKRICPWLFGRDDFDKIADRLFAKGGFGQYPHGDRHVDTRGTRARWTTFKPGK